MPHALPAQIQEKLTSWFSFPEEELYIQVATSDNNHPHLRTMKLYDITSKGQLVLLSRTETRKWRDLQHNPHFSACFLNLSSGQLVAEGTVELKTYHSDPVCAIKYWEKMPEEWQSNYLRASPGTTHAIPPSFGIILAQPRSWELLEPNEEDYFKSTRLLFRLIDHSWHMETLKPA